MLPTYSFGIPGIVIYALHIIAGLLLLYVGKNALDGNLMNRNIAILLIIIGSLAALYHAHLYFYNSFGKEKFRLNCYYDKTMKKHCDYIQDDEPKLRGQKENYGKEYYYAGR